MVNPLIALNRDAREAHRPTYVSIVIGKVKTEIFHLHVYVMQDTKHLILIQLLTCLRGE
jgi:hypothetical protein